MSQEEAHSGRFASQGIQLKSREITSRPMAQQVVQRGRRDSRRVHVIVQMEGTPLDLALLAAKGVRILGYIPTNGLAISAPVGENLAGLGFSWLASLEAADRRGFTAHASTEVDTPAYYIVQFYADADMGDARSMVLGAQVQIQDNPNLLSTQLLTLGTQAQMVELSDNDEVVFIFPAADELIKGIPVTPCVSGNTAYGTVLPFAASLSGGWSEDTSGTAYLTYSFGPLTPKMPADTVQQLFLQAQQQWAGLVNIVFSPTASRTGMRNVDLAFYSGDHGDGFPFDGPGGVLAHTFYPAPPNAEPIAGDMHMDADESWSSSGSGTDFYTVALHEMGHALGLGHTTGTTDVMYPFYRHNLTFSQTDINAIQSLYQARVAIAPPPAAQPLGLLLEAPAAQVTDATIALSGTASGGQGTLRVTWITDRGGLGNGQGSANWTIAAVPLALGRNTITVKVQDDGSAAVTQVVVVTRVDETPPVPITPQAPTLQILSPADGTVTPTASADVRGTATHPVGIKSISWRLGTGTSGVAQGTTAWDTGLMGLQAGVNMVTVNAEALDGGTASKTIQITVSGPPPVPAPGGGTDTTPPSLTIASPGTSSVSTSASTITITGTATDNVGVASVRWATAIAGGSASGTSDWSTGPISLYVGMNNIVIWANDAAGNSSWRSVSVTRR